MNKYFLYARKSTDVEDKQVLSIEAQLTELRAYARQEKLEIIEELIEKQSAKIPGRPIFNEMLSRIENDEADGIICWRFTKPELSYYGGVYRDNWKTMISKIYLHFISNSEPFWAN